MRSSRGRSNRKTYARNQQHNKQPNKPHNKHHNKHHHRHHGRNGWGDGMDSDGGDGGSDGASDASEVTPVVAPAPITILNPAETGRPVSYTLGSAEYSIEPAQSQSHNDGPQVITFDRGTALGQATYTLQPGTYRFVMTQSGWDLRSVTEMAAQTSAYAG